MDTPREQDCLNWLVKGGFFGNMACDLRPEGKEGAWFVKIWGWGVVFQVWGIAQAEFLRQDWAWPIWRLGMKVIQEESVADGTSVSLAKPGVIPIVMGTPGRVWAKAWRGKIHVAKNSFQLLYRGTGENWLPWNKLVDYGVQAGKKL